MAEEVTLSPSNNRLATAATEDFSDDEKYNEGGRASLPAIVPWRHMKNIVYSCAGIAVGTKRDLDSVDLGVYRKQNAALNAFPTTIPYGFQNTRSITHPRPSLKSVLYTAVTKLDSFLSCDAHSVVIQKGNSRPIAMSIDPEKRGKKNALAPESPFLGLSRWIFIPKWKITVIATLQLELKILSSSFENVASVSSVQPVLSFEFNEDTNELIAGGVGNIRVWGFEKPSNSLFPQGFTGPRLFISDLKANEWVTNVTIDKVFHRIFATVDNALFVYDYKTGRRLEVINGAHKSTISTMVFYQPLQYNITACTDGFIKVWTQQYRVLFELKDEASSPITGLLIPNAKESGSPSPFLISSAQDGVIRLWSLDSGSSIYMISTDNDCLGIRWMRQDTFLSYSQEGMSIWNLNRFFSTFSRTGSQVTHLKRIEGCKTEAARILVATEDRSMRILSPVRGTTLFTAFPNMIEHQIKDIEHDIPSATMWMLSANGEVSVYTTETNPAKIVDIWEVEAGSERVNTMCALRKKTNSDVFTDRVYALLGGTVAGQIVIYPINVVNSKYQVIVQAHAAEILTLSCDTNLMLVISLGNDGLIKIWRLEIATNVNPDVKPTSVGGMKPAGIISLVPLYSITIPHTSGTATGFSFHAFSRTLAVASSHNIISMYTITNQRAEEKTRHPPDEDHMKSITCLVTLDSMNIFASSSSEGSVKIWDGYSNIMLKEVQFGSNVLSICFCNSRGDLLVGTADQVSLLKMQDYLPPYILQELLFRSMPIIDDLDEAPLVFDDALDFWQLYRQNLIKNGRDLSKWHLVETVSVPEPKGDQLDLLEKLENLEHKHAEATRGHEDEERAIVAKETWQTILKMKKILERTVSSSNVKSKISRPVTIESTTRESVKPQRRQKSSTGFTTDEDDDMKPQEPIVSLDDDEEEDGVMTLDETVEFYQRRVSTFQKYRDRQQQQVEEELEKDNASVRRMSMRLQRRDSELTGRPRMAMKTPPGDRLMAAHKRAPSLGNAVQYKKDGKTQKEETSATAPVEPPDPEDSNVQKPASNKKGKKNVAASKRKKSIIKTKANGVGGGKEEKKQTDTIAGESSILTDVIPEGDEASAATDEVTVESIISGKRLRNQANAMTDVTETATPRILEAPKKTNLMVRRRTSGKINLTGLAMPNSVAVVNLQSMSDKNKFHHRRESQALLDIVDANGNASSSRATKNFALPQHLRSRRKKEDSIIALNLGTPGKPSDNPELAEELEDSPPHSPEPELNSNFLKSVVAIHKPESKLTVTEATTLIRIDTPPKSKKPASPAIQAKSTSASQEIVPEIVLIPDEESSSPLGSRSKTQTRDPSIIAIEIREPSIHDISTNLDVSLDMSDFMSRSLLRSKVPSKVPSMEFLPRVKSNRDIVGKRAVYNKKTAAIERHPSEPALLPPISLSAKSSLADLERPVHINLDAQKLLMAQKAWSLLEIAQQQDISEPTSGSFETLSTVKLSKAELLDEVTARDWFPGLNGKEANISNILEITMKVMKAGYWREKMEAAKATLYLYHTFENDLPNAVQDIILPQLDFLNDERWEVRAQFAMALGAYKVNHPEITLALISKLNDPSDAVKKAVKNSLATFGISSKEALRNVMGSLGLIPHITKKQKIDEDWLDVLLEKMRVEAEAEQQVTDDRIELWRRNVRNPRNTERLPSICTTLTYNPKNITRLSSEEKVVHDLLHQNLNTRLSSSIRASIAEVAALQARSKSQSLNKKNSIPNTLMDSLAQMHSHMNLK